LEEYDDVVDEVSGTIEGYVYASLVVALIGYASMVFNPVVKFIKECCDKH